MGKKKDHPQLQWRPISTPAADDGQQRPRQKPAASGANEDRKGSSSKALATGGCSGSGTARAAPYMAGSFIPPGCDADAEEDEARVYEESLVKGFWCPPRLRGRNESLIEAVNDWHFAMLNDANRNQFYWDAMEGVVKGKRVVDIGAGSGLLSLMAAGQGATQVIAIEASHDMVDLATLNIQRNGQEGKVRMLHNLSSNVTLPDDQKADVIISETLGALMLGEGMLDYLADARRRLARPGAAVIPAGGAQFAQLISSPSLAMVSNVQPSCCQGFDLSAIGSLQDTGNLFFTKQWGFRLNSIPDLITMSERIRILDVDFQATERRDIEAVKTFELEALHDGVIHAVVASWEVWSDNARTHKIATHPEETKGAPWGFARDMQWGQGLQLVEDFDVASKSDRNTAPAPFLVKAGEVVLLTVRFSVPCRQTFQFTLRRKRPRDTNGDGADKPSNGNA